MPSSRSAVVAEKGVRQKLAVADDHHALLAVAEAARQRDRQVQRPADIAPLVEAELAAKCAGFRPGLLARVDNHGCLPVCRRVERNPAGAREQRDAAEIAHNRVRAVIRHHQRRRIAGERLRCRIDDDPGE